ncbi:MAG: hypothetical protein ACKVUT_02345 [Gaiella sp.]
MSSATGQRRLHDFRASLLEMIDECTAVLTERQLRELRAVIHDRRRGRTAAERTGSRSRVNRQADEILALLNAASCQLRPRETQELDDLVAGKEPAPTLSAPTPVRLHHTRSAVR